MTRSLFLSAVPVLMATSLALPGCKDPEQQELAVLASAVERFHAATDEAIGARAQDVQNVPCREKRVCGVKALCVAATSALSQSTALRLELRGSTKDLDAGRLTPDMPQVVSMLQKLNESDRKLTEGQKLLADCDQEIFRLKRP